MLERDATRGPAWDVMRVPLSTLRLAASISLVTVSEFFRRMLFALAVFLKSADVVAVSGGLGGARGGGGATRLGGGTTCGSLSLSWPLASVASGASVDFLRSNSSREYMFSFAYVLDKVGYGKLVLEPFTEPMEPLRSISGTTAILCDLEDCDNDEVRKRSLEGRSLGRSPSVSSSLEAEERGLRVLVLLWRSLSLLLGLLRSRSGSFLRRRCESDELNISMAWGGSIPWCDCEPGRLGKLLRTSHSQRG